MHRPLGCKQDKRPGGVLTILSVASPLVRGKCTSGGSQYSCRIGPLRLQQREAPRNRRGATSPRPSTLQLCPYMVAARLMVLLWPGPDTPTQNYPHLTKKDMPGIQRCFFSTLDYPQQTHPHVLELSWTPPE